MDAVTIIALVVATFIIIFPAALIWYINIGGIVLAVKEARQKRAAEAAEKAAAIR
jgi:hypothetical protein